MATPTKPTKLPEWISDNTTNIVEPAQGKKDVGWLAAEEPPSQFHNWLFNLTYQWLSYMETITDYITFGDDVTKEITFPGIVTFEQTATFNIIEANELTVYDDASFQSKVIKERIYEANFSLNMKEDNETAEGGNQVISQEFPYNFRYESGEVDTLKSELFTVDAPHVPYFSPEITYTGTWTNITDSNCIFGGYKQTAVGGDTAIFKFLGRDVGIIVKSALDDLNIKAEFSRDDGVTWEDQKIFSPQLTNANSNHRIILYKGLPLAEYKVRLTVLSNDETNFKLVGFIYETKMIQKPTTHYMQTTETVQFGSGQVSQTNDTISLRGLKYGDVVQFTTTGLLPGGISALTDYYVIQALNDTANNQQTCKFSLTSGGASINITTGGTGTHTATVQTGTVTIDDVPPGTCLIKGSWNELNIVDDSAWNTLCLHTTADGLHTNDGIIEFKYYGTACWVNINALTDSSISVGFTIDGVTTNVLSTPRNFDLASVSGTQGRSHWVRIDDGGLAADWHVIKMTIPVTSGQTLRLSGFGYYAPTTANILDPSDADPVADTLAVGNNNGYFDNDIVRVKPKDSSLPAPLTAGTDYYVISATATTIQLSATMGGGAINITATSSRSFEVCKRLPTIAAAVGYGHDTKMYSSDDAIFTWNGSGSDVVSGWVGNANRDMSFMKRANLTTVRTDYVEFTTPANCRAVYAFIEMASTASVVKVTIGGTKTRWLDRQTDAIQHGSDPILLYDDVADGNISSQTVKIEHYGTDTNFVFEGCIFQSGAMVEEDSFIVFPTWARFNNSTGGTGVSDTWGAFCAVSNTFYAKVTGRTSDERAGILYQCHSGFLFQDTNKRLYFNYGMLLNTEDMIVGATSNDAPNPSDSGSRNWRVGDTLASPDEVRANFTARAGIGRINILNTTAPGWTKAFYRPSRVH